MGQCPLCSSAGTARCAHPEHLSIHLNLGQQSLAAFPEPPKPVSILRERFQSDRGEFQAILDSSASMAGFATSASASSGSVIEQKRVLSSKAGGNTTMPCGHTRALTTSLPKSSAIAISRSTGEPFSNSAWSENPWAGQRQRS